ncbi:MAG: DUF3098 domain-containing protein [Bacteroidetes bacterium]|nr:DUF3098 domain-containing protein [Bacteroidota bacterium]
MSTKKKQKKVVADPQKEALKNSGIHHFVFTRDNYKWMLIGLGIIVLGFVLMAGKTDDIFNNDAVFHGGPVSFSTKLKITVAPIMVLLGFCVEVYAILKKPTETATDEPS